VKKSGKPPAQLVHGVRFRGIHRPFEARHVVKHSAKIVMSSLPSQTNFCILASIIEAIWSCSAVRFMVGPISDPGKRNYSRSANFGSTTPGSTSRKGNSKTPHGAPENPTARRGCARATSSPPRFLIQKQKCSIRLILCLNSAYRPLLSKFATWMAAKRKADAISIGRKLAQPFYAVVFPDSRGSGTASLWNLTVHHREDSLKARKRSSTSDSSFPHS